MKTLPVMLIATFWPFAMLAQATEAAPPVVDSLAAIASAKKLAASGDTAGAVRILKAAAESAPHNAPLWYEYGTLLYAWTRPHWRKMPMPAGIPQRIIAAESSLARAMTLAPDSAQYAIDYARNLFGTNTTSLSTAQRTQNRAIDRASQLNDTARLAASAGHLGILLWRRFEQDADKFVSNPGAVVPEVTVRDELQAVGRKFTETAAPASVGLYNDALEYFRFARTTMPDDERPFRREAMALAFRGRWSELRTLANERRSIRRMQAWPWLSLGLADQREGNYEAAAIAFDSGFARLPENERHRLLAISRIMVKGHERLLDTLSDTVRSIANHVFWTNSDPSLLLPGNPLRTEFFARLVHAELLWTDDERPIQGAETHKGEVFIRYGPPDRMANKTWYYYGLNTAFTFPQTWGYGTAFLTPQGLDNLDTLRNKYGSTYHNLPLVRRGVDSIHFTFARFRAAPDSFDLLTISELPVGILRRDLPTPESRMRNALFTLDGNVEILTDNRSTITVRGGDSTSTLMRTQRSRTSVAARLGRLELLEPDAERVARAVFDISDFATRGFGTSDVVLSTSITSPAGAEPARWSDYTVEPSLGDAFKRGTPVDLLWEVYGLAPINGSTNHRVTIKVERIEEKGLVAVGARIIGGIQNAVRGNSSQGNLAVSYERTIPAREAFAERIRIDLPVSRVGQYQLTLSIEDIVTGQVSSRVRVIRLL